MAGLFKIVGTGKLTLSDADGNVISETTHDIIDNGVNFILDMRFGEDGHPYIEIPPETPMFVENPKTEEAP